MAEKATCGVVVLLHADAGRVELKGMEPGAETERRATGFETEAGNNANLAGPTSFAHTGEPVFSFTTGPVFLTFATTSGGTRFLTRFIALRQVSACDLLAG